MSDEHAINAIASTIKLLNEQQSRSTADNASPTHSLVSGLKESIERCLIDYDSRIDLVARLQKAQSEAAAQQAHAQ